MGRRRAITLLALAAPALGTRISNPGLHELPASVPGIGTLTAIQHAFPGDPAPAEVVITGRDLNRPAVRDAVTALHARAAASGGALREPITARLTDRTEVLIISVPLAGDGTGTASMRALAARRGRVLPATLGKVSGISYNVAGTTAASHDFTAAIDRSAPVVFAFVLALAFLLLMMVFRSLAIPAAAAADGGGTWVSGVRETGKSPALAGARQRPAQPDLRFSVRRLG